MELHRLPQPGGDSGSWGEILNDFLRQEHNENGSLKLRTELSSVVHRKDIALNVRDFGAKGDGATDDTQALQDAFDAVATGGGSVFIPAGAYLVSNGITVTKPLTTIFGEGDASILRATATMTGPNHIGSSGDMISILASQVGFYDMTIDGANLADRGIVAGAVSEITYMRLKVSGFKKAGLKAMGSDSGTLASTRCIMTHNRLYNCTDAFALDYGVEQVVIANNLVFDCNGDISCDWLNVRSCKNITITNNTLIGGTEPNGSIFVSRGANIQINDNIIQPSTGCNGIFLYTCTTSAIVNNQLSAPDTSGGSGLHLIHPGGAMITGNTIVNFSIGLNLRGSSGGIGYVTGNRIDGAPTPINWENASSDNYWVVRQNIGHITENAGVATIPNGNSSVVVNHGLSFTPGLQELSVTPTVSLAPAARYWISDATVSSFTIRVDTAAGATGLHFSWQAMLLRKNAGAP